MEILISRRGTNKKKLPAFLLTLFIACILNENVNFAQRGFSDNINYKNFYFSRSRPRLRIYSVKEFSPTRRERKKC
jgi:hypothetical protein